MVTFILSNENVNLNNFVTLSGRSHNPNLGRNLLFAHPWYIALNVGQQSKCVGRLYNCIECKLSCWEPP